MAAKLIAEEGDLKGLTLSLEDGEQWVIGRDPDACQLLVEDPSASRKQLICRTSPEGIILENLSDTNPVQVNNEDVQEPLLLKNGDTVKIGSGIFRFYAEEEAQIDDVEDDEPEEEKKEPIEAEEKTPEPTPEEEPPEEESPEPAPEEEIPEEEAIAHESIYEEATEEDKGILAEIDFDLRETGRWLLKVIGGPNNGAEFSMQSGSSYIIGTDPTSCDVVFHDTSVSRQHARITVSDDDTLTLEDLNSRNGTLVDGEPVKEQQPLDLNTLVTVGTTSFLVFDREGDMQTIISPLLPSIVKVLQKEDEEKEEEQKREESLEEGTTVSGPAAAVKPPEDAQRTMGAFILIGIITGLFIIVGIGTTTLFRAEPVVIKQPVDHKLLLKTALSPFLDVKYTYNKSTGGLFLSGHVLTHSEKKQLLYNLQGFDFIKNIDNNIVIDEFVWREINQILSRDEKWKGVSIHSPKAGAFVLSGFLQTRKQAEQLSDYILTHFEYPSLLDNRVIVEEDVTHTVDLDLDNAGIRNLKIQINKGELTLTGDLSKEQKVALDRLTRKFRELPGIRNVKTFITTVEEAQAMINITERYQVTGLSHQGGANLNIVIDGKILSRGDVLDGMTITSIRPSAIFLEKDGVKYRIDHNR